MRFGLVGTGYWARITHAPALASTEGIEFAAVWGRDPWAASGLAEPYGAKVHAGIEDFLADVDAVTFSVPPDVQAAIATRAARAGKHLLLEKPIAISEAAAGELVQAVQDARVASVVFFTSRFQENMRAWLADVTARTGWAGGFAVWLGTALREPSPFNTPWRRDKGGLWDLGPHAVSLLWACLGPVTGVTADGGPADVSHLILHHEGGATSTVTVTLSAPASAGEFGLLVWGEPGVTEAPSETGNPVAALRTALAELAEGARAGRTDHPCDVRFGHAVGRVLAGAQAQIDARRTP
ncbi:MAG TPA: Gfo/Idh/MocA family oxidoreductase [Streptosporangiaceae bacterium]|jgi:predicted dehydrogenase|nr:Gfo/Idh/MocA family oxidoreductase [Streptosporangiaceae bacterium]